MNHSLRTANPTTHLKVVCLSLIISTAVVVVAVSANGTLLGALASGAWSVR